MNRYTNKAALSILPLLLWSGLSLAENADRDKPIHLESDRVLVDDVKQTSVFEGKVELNQGTLRIQAEKIVLTQDKQGQKHCTATGNLANFRQKHEGTDEFMEGYGERIEYDTRAETVDFFVRARVKRELDDVQGDHISYSTRTEIFQVDGDPNQINDPNKGRVHAIIQPKNKESANPIAPKDAPFTIQPSSTLSKPRP
jgi:lipopolysaccharide export system protein LptA